MSAPACAEEPAAAERTTPAPGLITDAGQIAHLLGLAAGKRLVLAMGSSTGPRNALLLAADAVTRQLVIDPPFPSLPQQVEPGTSLSFSTRLEGAVLEFTTHFERHIELAGEEALLLRWPQRMRYLQRRGAHRLGIPRELHVPPALLRDGRGPVKATLVDLSRSGAGALVSRTADIRTGESLECTIRVDEVEFSASAEVRSCIASLDRLRLGLQFGEIPPVAAAKLSAAVAKLERVTLRRAAERRAREAF